MKRIVFTGGGTAGHVTPNIALFPKLRELGYDIHYSPEPDTLAFLIRMGAEVQEVKVEMDERKEGQSYLTPINAAKYMLRVLSSILLFQWTRKRENLEETPDNERVSEKSMVGGIKR